MKIEEIMVTEVITFRPDQSLYEAAETLKQRGISGGPVLEGGRAVGIISEADILKTLEKRDLRINPLLPAPFDLIEIPIRLSLRLRELQKKIEETSQIRLRDIMSQKVISISPDAEVSEAARKMARERINRLPVLDGRGRLVGIVTRGDIIAAL
jgi:CBS domain-containing protein